MLGNAEGGNPGSDPGPNSQPLARPGGDFCRPSQSRFKILQAAKMEAESAMQNVARAQRVHGIDPGYLNLKAMSKIPSQDRPGAACDGDVRHAPFSEPGDGRVRIGRPARNRKSLAAYGGGEQRRNLVSSGLPASSIQNQHRSRLPAKGEYRHGFVEM